MGQAALPNGYGPGRKAELVDSCYSVDDGLGLDLSPQRLHLAGLSRAQLDQVAHCMYSDVQFLRSFDLSPYDYPPIVGAPGDYYHEFAVRALSLGLRDWFDTLAVVQPLSCAILTAPETELLSGYRRFFENGPPNPGHHVRPMTAMVVRDRVISLIPYHTESPEEAGIAGFDNDAWPTVLLQSWWYRTAGFKIVRSVPTPVHNLAQPLLQCPGCGTGVNHLVADLGASAKRKFMPVLKEMFGADAVTKVHQMGKVALLCFLDTRPNDTIPTASGDQLFVHMARSDQTVYHVRACRFDQMDKIDPASLAECFDRYFAHVLGRVPGEFDFRPYLVPL